MQFSTSCFQKVTLPSAFLCSTKYNAFTDKLERKFTSTQSLQALKKAKKQVQSAAGKIYCLPFLMLSIRTGNPDCAAAINFKAM